MLVDVGSIALPEHRVKTLVGFESEPCEIVQQRSLVFGPAPDTIVIFNTEQNSSAERTRDPPDVDGVDHVSEVEMAGR